MPTLQDLVPTDRDDEVLVAAFPLEDTSKSIADFYPASWIDPDKQAIVPLLLAPKAVARELCKVMMDAGEQFLKEYRENQ